MVDYTCGNFPQYKVFEHVGHCWAVCPYDVDAPELRTRHLLGLGAEDPLPSSTAHIGDDNKHYYMKTTYKGSYGFICTYSGCTFLLENEQPYFTR